MSKLHSEINKLSSKYLDVSKYNLQKTISDHNRSNDTDFMINKSSQRNSSTERTFENEETEFIDLSKLKGYLGNNDSSAENKEYINLNNDSVENNMRELGEVNNSSSIKIESFSLKKESVEVEVNKRSNYLKYDRHGEVSLSSSHRN